MSKFDELHPFMNEFEQHITDLYALEKIVDAAMISAEALEVDKTLNLLIGLKEMLRYQSDVLHSDFTKAWEKFMTPIHKTKTWFAEIEVDGDYALTIPDDILKELGWEENDLLNIEVLENGTISITRCAEDPGVGCMGDELTDEQLEALKRSGGNIMNLPTPWDNA